jgi:hypothetical protein
MAKKRTPAKKYPRTMSVRGLPNSPITLPGYGGTGTAAGLDPMLGAKVNFRPQFTGYPVPEGSMKMQALFDKFKRMKGGKAMLPLLLLALLGGGAGMGMAGNKDLDGMLE